MENKTVPQNLEAEMAALGAMSSDSETAVKIMDILSLSDFSEERNGKIFEAIGYLLSEESKVDIITLSHKLEEMGVLSKIGGSSYLAQIINNTPSYKSGEKYAKIVRDKAILRDIIKGGQELIGASYNQKSAEEIAGIILSIEEIGTRYMDKGQGRKIEVSEVIDELFVEITEFESGNKKIFKTGFEQLDERVTGFIVPHIWIIGGYTGTGKTFFTLTLLLNLLRQGAKIVLFSTENNSTRNVLRLLGCMTGFSEMKLYKGKFTDAELEKIKEAKKELATFGLIIYDSVFSTEGILLKTKKHKLENKADLIVIDYIQNVNQERGEGEIYRQMSNVSLELQRMASKLGVGIIGVSQISNAGNKETDQRIMNFKGAGEISAISDVAILLEKSKKNFNILHAFPKKVRHGISGGHIVFEYFSKELMESGRYIKELKKGEENGSKGI
jgi:replicative DNA helicase